MRFLLTRLLCIIVALFVSFALHEVGHFAVLRLFGVGVDRFQVGLGPTLLHLEGKTTDVVIGALPFGGFVKSVSSGTRIPSEEQARLRESRPERLTMLLDQNQAIERLSHPQVILVLLAGPAVHGVLACIGIGLLWRSSHGKLPDLRLMLVMFPILIARLVMLEVVYIITLGRYGRTPLREKSILLDVGIRSSMESSGWVGALHVVVFLNWALMALNLYVPVPPLDGGKIVLELVEWCFGEIPKHLTIWIHAIGFCIFMTLTCLSGVLQRNVEAQTRSYKLP